MLDVYFVAQPHHTNYHFLKVKLPIDGDGQAIQLYERQNGAFRLVKQSSATLVDTIIEDLNIWTNDEGAKALQLAYKLLMRQLADISP